jgi:hypothetical protein
VNNFLKPRRIQTVANIAKSALSADLYLAQNPTLADRNRIDRPKVVNTLLFASTMRRKKISMRLPRPADR